PPDKSAFAAMALSPDGRQLAFTTIDVTGRRQLWIRALDEVSARAPAGTEGAWNRSEEHTSELQSRFDLVCRLLLEKKKYKESEERAIVPGCVAPVQHPDLHLRPPTTSPGPCPSAGMSALRAVNSDADITSELPHHS